MEIKETYPRKKSRRFQRMLLISYSRWFFLFAGFICPVVNITTGGLPWSIVVDWSLFMVWTQLISPDMVEFNRISQFIKFIVQACILLILINATLSPGWAVEVVPTVCFGGLIVVAILFFTDLTRQKQNMFPMLWFSVLCLVGSAIGLFVWRGEKTWSLAVMGILAFLLLSACIGKLGGEMISEFKKRFCTK